MLHTTDLADFERITGTNHIPPDFEAEYMLWLRMQHRMKHDGPLGVLMVPLCRQFNLKCPDAPAPTGTAVNWRQVQKGQRVRVQLDGGGVAKGTFRVIGSNNSVEVLLDDMPMSQEFPPFRVSVDELLPPDLKLSEAAKADMRAQVHDASLDYAARNPDAEEVFPSLSSIQGPDQRPSAKMDDPRWKSFQAGQAFKVNTTDGEVDAKFVRLFGPGQIIAEVNGEEDLIDELNCILPEVQVAKAPKKQTRKPRKKKAALA